jgi:ATP-dependent Lon protease
LENIKFKYLTESPSVIDILKMNVSVEQKQKLLEKVHCLANAEVLSEEYNANLKFLMSNISNEQDPELMKLEENILKSSLNNVLTDSYRTKILKSKMSFENKIIAYKKLEIMETYEETDTSEYAKYKAWMDSLLSVPFGIYNESGITRESSLEDIKKYIKYIRETLDKKLSFLEKPKDQIINIVTQMVRNPDVNINAIGLYGNPGLGKTAITTSIAEALGRPHATISLGGESDASSLTGHGFTYIGSGSGRLIDILRHTKTMNPIILVDELDKVSETHHGKEIIGTLIHLTDSTTNKRYNYDKYFSGIEFDLSKVLFIFTYNDPSKIDKILADRLFKIKVDNYNFKEKLEITNKHIIPYMLDKFKFNKDDIEFSEEAVRYLVNSSKDNEGMRNIKLKIKIILSRINTLLLTNEEDNVIHLKYKKLYPYYKTLPVKIPDKHIDIFLDESISNENLNEPPPFMYL